MRDDSGDSRATPAGTNPSDQFPGYGGMPLAVLRRYVRRESDAPEQRRVDAWAAASIERRHYLDAMRRLRDRAPVHTAARSDAAWFRLAQRLERPVKFIVRAPRPRHRALLIAAGGLAAVLGATALYRAATTAAPAPAPPVMRLIETTKGQRAEIRLSDGSSVALGVDSRLRFASDFGARARDLILDGTAYFDVVHDSTRPFRIHTSTAIAEDIGTRFVVTAYPERPGTQVVVTAGTVSVRATHAAAATAVDVTAGHLAQVRAGVPAPVVRLVDTSGYTAWMRGRLVFRDTPLADVVAELRRWYDVDVRIGSPSLARIPLSASFAAESFDQAMRVVSTVVPLRVVRRGKVVTLYHR